MTYHTSAAGDARDDSALGNTANAVLETQAWSLVNKTLWHSEQTS